MHLKALALCLLLLLSTPLGAQLKYLETSDLRLVFSDPTLTHLVSISVAPLDVSLGYAAAREGGQSTHDQLMASLKIL